MPLFKARPQHRLSEQAGSILGGILTPYAVLYTKHNFSYINFDAEMIADGKVTMYTNPSPDISWWEASEGFDLVVPALVVVLLFLYMIEERNWMFYSLCVVGLLEILGSIALLPIAVLDDGTAAAHIALELRGEYAGSASLGLIGPIIFFVAD